MEECSWSHSLPGQVQALLDGQRPTQQDSPVDDGETEPLSFHHWLDQPFDEDVSALSQEALPSWSYGYDSEVPDFTARLPPAQPLYSADLPGTNDLRGRAKEDEKGSFRFSFEAVRVLRAWHAEHMERPYPSVGEVEVLQSQTGLSKTQVLNWFANTRRRVKLQDRKLPATSSSDLPPNRQRRPSPAPFRKPEASDQLNPLQRWQNSPPENEPVSVSAIARHIASVGEDSPSTSYLDSAPASSASSFDLSQSGDSSCSSVHSFNSRGSLEFLGHLPKRSKRRRRRLKHERHAGQTGNSSLRQTAQPFCCTFCTETFKTKYNWQRHEKTYHLSLEQWQCIPHGPVFLDNKSNPTCVYCGVANPDDHHLATHNYETCANRTPQHRTFTRKDHLRQHLKLVHDVEFRSQPMDLWKFESQEIRSQCGFCGLIMATWNERVDHITDHFKAGNTMAGWQGDWGFEPHISGMVENSMPPYLIHYESSSPWPFTTHQGPPNTPTSAFELIQIELEYYATVRDSQNTNCMPLTDRELQYEACCIILGADIHIPKPHTPAASWARDVLMSSEDIAQEARFRPLKVAAKTRLTQLMIRGKRSIFEACSLEDQLVKYVEAPKLLGLVVKDTDLQREACDIVRRAEQSWPSETGIFGNLLVRLICGSAGWLESFRQREGLESSLPVASIYQGVTASTVLNQMPQLEVSSNHVSMVSGCPATIQSSTTSPLHTPPDGVAGSSANTFSHDDNCYRKLTRDLSTFITRTMSKNNPNRHVPTDAEIQNQARWIMFDDDDPWNQTPADNSNWLDDFKSNIGFCSVLPNDL